MEGKGEEAKTREMFEAAEERGKVGDFAVCAGGKECV
jgi:hypothetical protein